MNNRIDTLKICASEVSIRDSSIIPCLDALISDTKKLHEYDKRIEPLFWIYFTRLVQDSVLVDFESNNSYASLDLGFLLGIKDASLLPKVDYEVLVYRDTKFIVMTNNDLTGKVDIELDKIKKSYFESTRKKLLVNTYRFTSKDDEKLIEDFYLWSNLIEFTHNNGKLHYIRKIYHPMPTFSEGH